MIEASRDHGNKLASEQAAAERLGIRWSSLRGYLEAAQVVDRISSISVEAAQILRSRPVDIVRSIGRWSRFDLPGAIAFILEHSTAPTGLVLKAERRARHKKSTPSLEPDIATRLETEWGNLNRWRSKYLLHPVIAEQLGILEQTLLDLRWDDPFPLDRQQPQENYEKALGIETIGYFSNDRLADQLDGNSGEVARTQFTRSPYWHPEYGLAAYCFLQLSRYSVVEAYRREAKSLQWRALLAAELYPVVVLPVPSEAARTELLAGFAPTSQRFWMDTDRSDDGREAPIPTHVLDAPPHILLPGRSRGAIIVTTPETVIADLFIDDLERYRHERDARRAMQSRKSRLGAD